MNYDDSLKLRVPKWPLWSLQANVSWHILIFAKELYKLSALSIWNKLKGVYFLKWRSNLTQICQNFKGWGGAGPGMVTYQYLIYQNHFSWLKYHCKVSVNHKKDLFLHSFLSLGPGKNCEKSVISDVLPHFWPPRNFGGTSETWCNHIFLQSGIQGVDLVNIRHLGDRLPKIQTFKLGKNTPKFCIFLGG